MIRTELLLCFFGGFKEQKPFVEDSKAWTNAPFNNSVLVGVNFVTSISITP